LIQATDARLYPPLAELLQGSKGSVYIVGRSFQEASRADLENDRDLVIQSVPKYRWYDTQEARATVQYPLRTSLERVLLYCVGTDHQFLSREQLLNAALALMVMSWSQKRERVVDLNELGQRAFHLAETRYPGLLHPIAWHLYHHNRIDRRENGAYAIWGLFDEPIPRHIADAAIMQTEMAWEPLNGLKEPLPLWNTSLEEMVAYQQACRVVSRVIHPDVDYHREAKRLLDFLRERGVSTPSHRSQLMRAELSYAKICQPRSGILAVLEKYANEAPGAGNADEAQWTSLVQLNLFAESSGSLGDKGAVARILTMPRTQREFFLLRDKHNILPSARHLLLKNYSSEDRNELSDLLRVPASSEDRP
jgi:hypothetical protein